MKKTAKLFLLIMLSLALLALSSCAKKDENFKVGDKMTIVVAEDVPRVFEVPLQNFKKSNSVKKVLDYLEATGEVDYEMSGTMVTKVGSLKNEGNVYVYFYTTVERDVDVSVYATTVEYGGITITNAGVGVEDMHIENGAVIYIGTITW